MLNAAEMFGVYGGVNMFTSTNADFIIQGLFECFI